MELKYSTQRGGIIAPAFIALLSVTAVAQEVRSEISVQGTGFFTKDQTATVFETTSPKRADF